MSLARTSPLAPEERPRYLAAAPSLHFPESAEMPESELHLELRTLLYQLLKDYLGLGATVGSDQFVYYDASDPKRVLAPDVYAQLKPPTEKITSWKVWERGAPDVAVEILSASDSQAQPWRVKLQRYAALGVKELVAFSADSEPTLRVWDRVNGNLVERVVDAQRAVSLVCEFSWVVAPGEGNPKTLRIMTPAGELVPLRSEARQALQVAEARIRELEAQLKGSKA
jgi:Uma2 family endonuclease